MLPVKLNTVKHVRRLKQIVVVLLKYGFDDIVERLDLPGKLLLKKVMPVKEHLTAHERVRRALEDLGPAYIKFGQIMSLRSDLLPAELIFELRKLHDKVPAVEFSEIRQQIEGQLQQPIDAVFCQFEDTPSAAASLAQVHQAVLRDERQPVAVKIQRPGIRAKIESDIAIMELIAGQLHQRMEAAAVYDLPQLVKEFKRTLLRELDYQREARHMRIFKANFANDPLVHVPVLYDDFCTEKLLVMELVNGVKLSEVSPNNSEQRAEMARRGLSLVVKQVLEDGFFHADPHPGNIIVRPDGQVSLLDCGMVGRLTDDMRFKLTDLIQAVVNKDEDRLVDILLDLTHGHDACDRQRLQQDILDLLDTYHSVPLAQLNLGRFLANTAEMLCDHHLRFPQNLAMMIKALITAEGVARDLDPELDIVAEIHPLVKKLIAEQWKPENIWRALRNNLSHVWALQRQLPQRLNQIVEKLEQGELAIKFQHENLDRLHHTLEDIASRLTVAIIIAAMVIGSSLIVTANAGPTLLGYPALGVFGYLISALLGLWIVVNILRSNKW